MIDFESLANPRVRTLRPYEPGKAISELQREQQLTEIIKLASNENALGPSPKAILAAQQALSDAALYPEGSGHALKKALADFLPTDIANLTLGNGSDSILAMVLQAFVAPEQDVLVSEYAFSNYAVIARANHANAIVVPSKNYGHDLNAMANAITDKTRLIFISNPNNPTGTYNTQTEVEQLLATIPAHVLVILDEAYYEYVEVADYPKALALQKRYPNLIITRTFSKIYGLAGLRVGYSISHPQIADLLNRVRLPFNVNNVAFAAAIAALKDDEHKQKTLAMTRAGRDYLLNQFKKMGLHCLPAMGNFITVDVARPALPVYESLLAQGIIVRPLQPYLMPQHLRITIGTSTQNTRLCAALSAIIRE